MGNNEKSDDKVIPTRIIYQRSSEVKTLYVTGARGVLVGQYDYRLEFYTDDPPKPVVMESNGKSYDCKEYDVETNSTLKKNVQVELIMPIKSVRELKKFLEKAVEKLDSTGEVGVKNEKIKRVPRNK